MMVPRNTTTSKEDSNIMFTLHFTHLTAVQFLRMRNDVLWRIASESTVLECMRVPVTFFHSKRITEVRSLPYVSLLRRASTQIESL